FVHRTSYHSTVGPPHRLGGDGCFRRSRRLSCPGAWPWQNRSGGVPRGITGNCVARPHIGTDRHRDPYSGGVSAWWRHPVCLALLSPRTPLSLAGGHIRADHHAPGIRIVPPAVCWIGSSSVPPSWTPPFSRLWSPS